jgi:hypothetical protein
VRLIEKPGCAFCVDAVNTFRVAAGHFTYFHVVVGVVEFSVSEGGAIFVTGSIPRSSTRSHRSGRKAWEMLEQDGILMTAVDTGWITDERPHPAKLRLADEGFHAPLDLIDSAARVYDPIVRGELGEDLHSCFLKDYSLSNWVAFLICWGSTPRWRRHRLPPPTSRRAAPAAGGRATDGGVVVPHRAASRRSTPAASDRRRRTCPSPRA